MMHTEKTGSTVWSESKRKKTTGNEVHTRRKQKSRREENKTLKKWLFSASPLLLHVSSSPLFLFTLHWAMSCNYFSAHQGFCLCVSALKTSLCPTDFQQNKEHIYPKDRPGQEVTLAAGTNMASCIIQFHSTFTLISPPSTSHCGDRQVKLASNCEPSNLCICSKIIQPLLRSCLV